MATKAKLALAAAITIAIATAAGLLLWETRAPARCSLCHRGIHAASRAVIEIRGERKAVCCVRCAITAESQESVPVKLLEVSDFRSGKPLQPENGYYVASAAVVLCAQHEAPTNEQKQRYVRVFDRCEPSILAFSTETDARSFAAQNGGEVARLDQIVGKYGVQR